MQTSQAHTSESLKPTLRQCMQIDTLHHPAAKVTEILARGVRIMGAYVPLKFQQSFRLNGFGTFFQISCANGFQHRCWLLHRSGLCSFFLWHKSSVSISPPPTPTISPPPPENISWNHKTHFSLSQMSLKSKEVSGIQNIKFEFGFFLHNTIS